MTMVATTLDVGRPSLEIAAGDLVLRICNSWRQGQTVRLKSAKCTIGSGPHCTLRLRARGVLPLHCLILRGRAATVVRRWSADTRLNDRSFADAVLSPGDRLSIGSIELEVLSMGATVVAPQPLADRSLESTGETDFQVRRQRHALEEEQQRLDELAENLRQYQASLAAEAEHHRVERTRIEAQRQAIDQEWQQWQGEQEQAQRQLNEQHRDLTARLADFEAQENALAEERRQWEAHRNDNASQVAVDAERTDIVAQRQVIDQEWQQWQTEQEQAQRQLNEQHSDLTARLANFEAQENALAEERRQWEAHRNDNASQVAAEGERLNARRAELDADSQSLEQQRQQWQAERDGFQRQLGEQRNELAARLANVEAREDEQRHELTARLADFEAREDEQRHELAARLADVEAQKNALAEERRQWETHRSDNASEIAAEAERLNARRAEVEADLQSLEQRRQQWQAERDGFQRQLDEQRNELVARLANVEARKNEQRNELAAAVADVEAQKNALAEERRQWEAHRNDNASEVATEAERLNARRAELDADRQSLEQQRQQWQAEQDEAQRQWDEQRNQLAARQTELEAERSALETDRRQWEQQRAELARTAEQSPVSADPAVEAAPSDEATQQEPEFETPSEGAPVDLAAVLRRVGANIEPGKEASPPPGMTMDQTKRLLGGREPSPAKDHGDEESIDDYMNRLMQRVRAKSGEPERASHSLPRSEQQPASQSQASVAVDPAPTVQPVVPAPSAAARKPVEMSPRSAAPEKRIDISAFRELANFSARAAVSRHSRKILVDSMRSKLVMAIMALAAGGGLFWMWQRYGAVEMTLYYSLAAVLVAIYFGVQYALLTGRLRINELGHINIAWNAFATDKPAMPPVENDANSPQTPAAAKLSGDSDAEPAAEEASND